MTREEFIGIMEGDYPCTFNGDKAFRGLQAIAKYTNNVLYGATHDEIWSESVDKLIKNGITREDVENLRSLGFRVKDSTYLARFV